jgi:hypothetical protein
MYASSSIRPFRNVVCTSINWIFQPIYVAMAIILVMEVYLTTGVLAHKLVKFL